MPFSSQSPFRALDPDYGHLNNQICRKTQAASRAPLSKIESLPTETLLEIVHWVGKMSTITHEPGSSPLLNLSLTSRTIRDACLRQLFRGVIIDVEDTMRKHSKLFVSSTYSSEIVNDQIPYMTAKIRSLAITTRCQDITAPRVDMVMIQRAIKLTNVILSSAKLLEKLHLRLPITNVHTSLDLYHRALPSIKQLVVNPGGRRAIRRCPNVHTLALVGFRSTGRDPSFLAEALLEGANIQSIRNLEVDCLSITSVHLLPRMESLENLKLVLELPTQGFVGLFDVVFELQQKSPLLKTLIVVMAGPPRGQSDSWRLFCSDFVVESWSEYFFERLQGLEEHSIACVAREGVNDTEPRLVSLFQCQRRQRNSAKFDGPFKQLKLPGLSHREWVPSLEGPP
ncbi:hypothetical protein IWZ01DRAFT_123412 [Phyllosticta capitalensis]